MIKITIITINYNNNNGLIDTIRSVSEQTYPFIEHIVIDGGSLDLCIETIDKQKHFAGAVIMEPDKGIYDAMNKGVSLATGDYIGFLNSGDVFVSPNVVREYADAFTTFKNLDACYSNIWFSKNQEQVRWWTVGNFHRVKFLFGWMMPHPSLYVRRSIFREIGNFDASFSIAGDYDWMLRAFFFRSFKPKHLNLFSVKMEVGGLSNESALSILRSNFEVLKAWGKATWFIPFWIFLLKPFSKIFQLVK